MIGATAAFSRRREKQTRYLSQALQLEESVNPHIIRATMVLVSLAIMGFFIWAGFTNINEVARAPGEVVPSGYQKTVQHLEGGIIEAIHIREGDVVEQGQILVTLNDAGIRKDFERANSKQLSLEMQAERLRAFAEGREPNFSLFPEASSKMVADQKIFFQEMRNAREKEAQVIGDQIAQKKRVLESFNADLDTARQNLKIIDDIYRRRATLNAKGYASDMQLLEDKKRLNDIKGEIERLESQSLAAESAIREFEVRLQSLNARHRDEAYEKLDQVLAEQSQNIETILKLEERIGRLDIKAPTRGLVKGLAINTIGGVVHPGETLMEIVPLDKQLEIQVKISPKDIGHVEIGQPVQVKFSTYDFSRYGSVKGRLGRISATTFTGENGERYYQGAVLLEQTYVGINSNIILPGMTVMADVITGEKTILEYLLKPIQRALKTAFTER